jgi:hypothetical protein
MGAQKVRIPAPDGFVEISSEFKFAIARLRAAEDPVNDLAAVHVPETFVPQLRINEDIDLDLFTKILVSKQTRGLDLTPELFAAVVAGLENNFSKDLDPDGELMKHAEKNSGKGLTKFRGTETPVDISGTKNLGFFQKTDQVFSGMMGMTLEVYGRKIPMLCTLSFVKVKKRLLFAYAYKLYPAENDVAMLIGLTKNWTAKIVETNK